MSDFVHIVDVGRFLLDQSRMTTSRVWSGGESQKNEKLSEASDRVKTFVSLKKEACQEEVVPALKTVPSIQKLFILIFDASLLI